MNMKDKSMKKYVSFLLIILLSFSSAFGVKPVLAEDEDPDEVSEIADDPVIVEAPGNEDPGVLPFDDDGIYGYHNEDGDTSYLIVDRGDEPMASQTLPSSFDLRDYGLVSTVKNQKNYGTCWAHAAMASAESSYLKKNHQELDLSELHLSYYAYHSVGTADPLGLITDDGMKNKNEASRGLLQGGGNVVMASYLMASGIGLVNEEDMPYSDVPYYNVTESYFDQYDSDFCYGDNDYYVTDVKWINVTDATSIKKVLMEYGAVTVSYYAAPYYGVSYNGKVYYESDFYNEETNAYYNYAIPATNHGVAIVGWDDEFDRNNFVTAPDKDGAWLIKNSWGKSSGDEGYYWISYEDKGLKKSDRLCQFMVEPTGGGISEYQHDGTAGMYHFYPGGNTGYVASIFKAQKDEYLFRVGFTTYNPNTTITVKIYRNVGNTPDSGKLVCQKKTTRTYAGIHTLVLDEPVKLTAGKKFSVVIKESSSSSVPMVFNLTSGQTSGWYSLVDKTAPGQSFSSSDGSSWNDLDDYGMTAVVKAYTVENVYQINYHDTKGAENPNPSVYMQSSSSGTLVLQDISADGYRFLGWYEDPEHQLPITQINTNEPRDYDLYADWEVMQYPITYVLDGGSNDPENPESYDIESETIVLKDAHRTGYIFEGWYKDAAFKKKVSEIPTGSFGELTLYAKWMPITYVLRYHSCLEGVEPYEETFTYDVPQKLKQESFNISLLHFLHWNTQEDDEGTFYQDEEEILNLSDENGKVIDLYAFWEIKYATPEPYAMPGSSELEKGASVSLFCDDADADIYYTTDGTTPTRESELYVDSLILSEDMTLKAFAVSNYKYDSGTATYEYVLKPGDYGGIDPIDLNEYPIHSPDEIPEGLWTSKLLESVDYDPDRKSITQDFRVYHHKTLLKEGTDYTVKYSGNKKAGTASLTITGKGNYGGSLTRTFEILPLDITEDVEIGLIEDYAFNSKGTALSPKATYGSHALKNKTDYSFTITDENGQTADRLGEPGVYAVTFTGKGNYSFSVVRNVTVIAKDRKLVSKLTVTLSPSKTAYAAGKIRPKVTVKDGKEVVFTYDPEGDPQASNDLFAVRYENNVEVGKGRVIIEAASGEGKYAGSVTKTFEITGVSLSRTKLNDRFLKEMEYTGEALEQPDGFLTYDGEALQIGRDYEVLYENNVDAGTARMTITGTGGFTGTLKKTFRITGLVFSAKTITVQGLDASYVFGDVPNILLRMDDSLLNEGTDYAVSFKNDRKVGTATATFRGIGRYEGSFSKTYKITARPLDDADISVSQIGEQIYVKGGVKAQPDLQFRGETLTTKDYTLTYRNNAKVGTATVTVKGKGNFKGSIDLDYPIIAQDLSVMRLNIQDRQYGTKKGSWKSTVSLFDLNGKKLTAGTDYEKNVSYTYVYDAIVRDGSSSKKVKPIIRRSEGDPVGANDIVPAGTLIKVTVNASGSYQGAQEGTYRIVAADISKASVKIPAQYYTGREILLRKEQITVKLNKETLDPSDYVILSYSNNVKKGTATVVLQGRGNYGGTNNAKFAISQRSFNMVVRFNANGGTGTMKDLQFNKDTRLTANAFKRTGYVFEGWSIVKDGEKVYEDRELFDYRFWKAGTVTGLYAVWKKTD